MKMRIRLLAVCLFAVCCMQEAAFAKIIATPDSESNSISIYGPVSRDKVQVVLLAPGASVSDAESIAESLDKSGLINVIEYYGIVAAKDKNIETVIPMRADTTKGEYILVVDKTAYPICFATQSDRLTNMVPDAKSALTGGTFAAFVASDGKYFCDASLLSSLNNTASVAKYSAAILDESKNASDSEFMSKMSPALNMGIVMEALNESKIDDFNTLKAMTDDSGMTVPIEKADLIKSDKLKNVIAGVSGKSFSTPEAYKKQLSESIFINVIYNAANMTNEAKKDFFETYAEQLGLNLTEYNKLNNNKRIEAIAKLSATNKTSLALLQSSLDEICKGTAVPVTTGGGGGGGGGSSIVYSDQPTANGDTAHDGFMDLAGCTWAQPAIEYLVSRNMVSGYGDNTFKPFNKITRAEFITIVARKFLSGNYDTQSFSDVASDKWYFNYVESAYKNGIISGMEENLFAPDANISRQDMAVILYRLAGFLGLDISADSAEFADNADIADYSKNAIYRLKGAGIVNGDENGRFNPKATATRAEAVQMIYGFMKSFE